MGKTHKRNFTKEDTRMTKKAHEKNKNMLNIIANKGRQIKITVSYHYTLSELLK